MRQLFSGLGDFLTMDYRELISSQLPALHLLTGIGWKYLPPSEVDRLRGNRRGAVILEGVLSDWLRTRNLISYKNQIVPFSPQNITEALRRLKTFDPSRGIVARQRRDVRAAHARREFRADDRRRQAQLFAELY